MYSASPAMFLVVVAAGILLLTGIAQAMLRGGCGVSNRLGGISHGIAEWFAGLSRSLGSMCASVFHGIRNLLASIFSWETLLWFLAAGGLIGFAVMQNHPGEFSRWLDEIRASDVVSPRIAFIALVPLLFVLIALGRMHGVRWHSRQMGAVGVLLLAGGLMGLTFLARSSHSVATRAADARHVAEFMDQGTSGTVRHEGEAVSGAAVVFESDDRAVSSDITDSAGQFDTREAAASDTPEESPGPIQAGDEADVESGETSDVEELETIGIQVVDATGQTSDVPDVPEWVELAGRLDRRTIAVDTQWHPSILAVWMDTTPEEAELHAPSPSMLYGEVATLHESSSAGEYVVSVAHVGSIDEGETFAEFAAARIAYDRLFEFYPQIRGWRAVGRVTPSGGVVEQCVETSMLHIGDFEVPVYTYHALVHLDQTADLAAVAQWQKHERFERLVMGGIALGGIVWLFAIVAAYLRINIATAGRHRAWLRAGALACLLIPPIMLFAVRNSL